MKNRKGIAILGTKQRGGIHAVINNHIQAGVYDGYNHFYIPSHDEGSASKRIRLALKACITLLNLIICNKISIVHLHGSYNACIYRNAIFLLISKLFNRHVIFHLHGSEFEKLYESGSHFYRLFVRFILNKSDCIFVLSKYWKEYVQTITINPNIKIINNFPSPIFEDLYEQRTFNHKAQIEMLFLGLIGDRKGVFDLVDAVELLKGLKIKGFRITVGGNGEIEKLRHLIKEKELEDYFNVIGWVSGDQKYKLIKDSDLLLLPSHNEGLPIAILEALSSGLAVLSTRVGGIPDAIRSDRYGILIEPSKPYDLAKAIHKYIKTDGLIEKVARNARQLYNMAYSSKVNVSVIRHVYDEFSFQ